MNEGNKGNDEAIQRSGRVRQTERPDDDRWARDMTECLTALSEARRKARAQLTDAERVASLNHEGEVMAAGERLAKRVKGVYEAYQSEQDEANARYREALLPAQEALEAANREWDEAFARFKGGLRERFGIGDDVMGLFAKLKGETDVEAMVLQITDGQTPR